MVYTLTIAALGTSANTGHPGVQLRSDERLLLIA